MAGIILVLGHAASEGIAVVFGRRSRSLPGRGTGPRSEKAPGGRAILTRRESWRADRRDRRVSDEESPPADKRASGPSHARGAQNVERLVVVVLPACLRRMGYRCPPRARLRSRALSRSGTTGGRARAPPCRRRSLRQPLPESGGEALRGRSDESRGSRSSVIALLTVGEMIHRGGGGQDPFPVSSCGNPRLDLSAVPSDRGALTAPAGALTTPSSSPGRIARKSRIRRRPCTLPMMAGSKCEGAPRDGRRSGPGRRARAPRRESTVRVCQPPPKTAVVSTTSARRGRRAPRGRRWRRGRAKNGDRRGGERIERERLRAASGPVGAPWRRRRPASACRRAERGRAGASGTRRTRRPCPARIPACGPAKSLSPEKPRAPRPRGERSAALSSRRSRKGPRSAIVPDPWSWIHADAVPAGQRGDLAGKKRVACTPDLVVEGVHRQDRGDRGRDAAREVLDLRPVRRSDLLQPCSGSLEDLGNLERSSDRDELSARDENVAPGRDRRERAGSTAPALLLTTSASPAPTSSATRAPVRRPGAAFSARQIELTTAWYPSAASMIALRAVSDSGARPRFVWIRTPVALTTLGASGEKLDASSSAQPARRGGEVAVGGLPENFAGGDLDALSPVSRDEEFRVRVERILSIAGGRAGAGFAFFGGVRREGLRGSRLAAGQADERRDRPEAK